MRTRLECATGETFPGLVAGTTARNTAVMVWGSGSIAPWLVEVAPPDGASTAPAAERVDYPDQLLAARDGGRTVEVLGPSFEVNGELAGCRVVSPTPGASTTPPAAAPRAAWGPTLLAQESPDGSIDVVVEHRTDYEVRVAHRDAHGAWSTHVMLPAGSSYAQSAAFDERGRAVVLYCSSGPNAERPRADWFWRVDGEPPHALPRLARSCNGPDGFPMAWSPALGRPVIARWTDSLHVFSPGVGRARAIDVAVPHTRFAEPQITPSHVTPYESGRLPDATLRGSRVEGDTLVTGSNGDVWLTHLVRRYDATVGVEASCHPGPPGHPGGCEVRYRPTVDRGDVELVFTRVRFAAGRATLGAPLRMQLGASSVRGARIGQDTVAGRPRLAWHPPTLRVDATQGRFRALVSWRWEADVVALDLAALAASPPPQPAAPP